MEPSRETSPQQEVVRKPAASPALRPCDEKLLSEAGFEAPFVAERLGVGRNNQVYRVSDRKRSQVVLKRFFHHDGDKRDRLDREWKFLAWASECAAGAVPEPLARNRESRVALLEYIPGEAYLQEPAEAEVKEAIGFIECLNRRADSAHAAGLPEAADACFDVDDHGELLRSRLSRLETIDDTGVRTFIRHDLLPAGQSVIRSVGKQGFSSRKPQRIVSPSDFGFHNAIRRGDGSGTCFLDFEYAGWDGAGKMIADFFSQPDIPVNDCYLPVFLDAMKAFLDRDAHRELVRTIPFLLALHSLKWCCIFLNDFLPVDSRRRRFSGNTDSGKLRLEKAQAYFQTVCLPRLQRL